MPGKKFRTIKRKKRKLFCGTVNHGTKNQDTQGQNNEACASSSEQEVRKESCSASTSGTSNIQLRENKSKSKLENSTFDELEQNAPYVTRNVSESIGKVTRNIEESSGFKLVDILLLQEQINSATVCRNCTKTDSKLIIQQNNERKNGLAEELIFKCNRCSHEVNFPTSRRLGGQNYGAFEVNRRSVIATLSTGGGLSTLQNFCTQMNLPSPVTSNAFHDHLNKIENASREQCEIVLNQASGRLRQEILSENPEVVFEDIDGALPCSVTVDGTWQKRGHSSKIGVVFIISVKTGEVLDYEVKSLVCHECSAHESMDHNSDEYKSWKESHDAECLINHEGSSDSMESAAAVEMFLRSIEKRGLKYTVYVGDGDSDSFGKVKAAVERVYGERYPVVKEDCVGHIQKRMGTALRKYIKEKKAMKLGDGKGVGGKGRLTDAVIDDIQGYYGKAIRGHKGDLEGMINAVWAIYNHMICSSTMSLKDQHKYCPKGNDSWCKFNKDCTNKTSQYKQDHRLPEVFRSELLPIFTRLSKNDLLSRCLDGMTQNQNESINAVLWSKCPKTKFCGKRRVEIAVCETIGVFNIGAAAKADLMRSVGVTPGRNMLKGLRNQDSKRIVSSNQKVSKVYIIDKKKKRRSRKAAAENQSKSYISGAFGLSETPDFTDETAKVGKGKGKGKGTGKRKRKESDNESACETEQLEAVPIMFVEPLFERLYHKPRK